MKLPFKNKSFKFPVTSQIGSPLSNIKKVAKGKNIDKAYRTRFRLTKMIAAILDIPRALDTRYYKKNVEFIKLEKPPVFIIGFWRSGTTLMHNFMSQYPEAAFVSTFQSVFPHDCFVNKWWIQGIGQHLLPEKRPGGDIKFDFDHPQEEEVAISNMLDTSFYNFFYYPNDLEFIMKEGLSLDSLDEEELKNWKNNYDKIIKIALKKTNGSCFISKNPPNTVRIKQLLKFYPDAKFIYLYRDKYESLYSFQNFINQVHDGVKYQEYDKKSHLANLIKLYKYSINRFKEDKELIPSGNLIEVDFHHFEKNILEVIESIFTKFEIAEYQSNKSYFESYYKEIRSYIREPHKIPDDFKNEVDDLLNRQTFREF